MTMAVSGTVGYFFPSIQKILWINVLISFFLLVKIVFLLPQSDQKLRGRLPSALICMSIFLLCSICSVVLNFNFKESLFASKNYFQFWPIPLVFYYIIYKDNVVKNYFKFFVALAVFMPIITIIQFIVYDARFDIVT